MTFDDVPAGESLFIDANTFVYHFGPHPIFGQHCTELLERMASHDRDFDHVPGITRFAPG